MQSLILLFLCSSTFYLTYPSGRCCYLLKCEQICIDYIIKFYICIVALNNLCCRLKSTNNLFNSYKFLSRDLRYFIQKDYITELYLLDDKILYILLIYILSCKFFSAIKLTLKAKSINYCSNTIKTWSTILY